MKAGAAVARAPVAVVRAPVALVEARTRSCRNMAGVAMARAPVVAAKVPATLMRAPTRPFRNLRRVQSQPEVHFRPEAQSSPEQPVNTLESSVETGAIDEPTTSSSAASTPIPEAGWAAAEGVGLDLLGDATADKATAYVLDVAVARRSPVPLPVTLQGLDAPSSAVPQPPPEGQVVQEAFEAAAPFSSAPISSPPPSPPSAPPRQPVLTSVLTTTTLTVTTMRMTQHLEDPDEEPGGVSPEPGEVSQEFGWAPAKESARNNLPQIRRVDTQDGRVFSPSRSQSQKEIRAKILQERCRRQESTRSMRQAVRVNIAQQPANELTKRSSHRQHRHQALMAIRTKHAQAQLAQGVQTGGGQGRQAFGLFKHTLAYKAAMKLMLLCGQLGGTCREEHTIVSMIAPPQEEEALTPAQTIQVS